jgi:periplasmic copper chaperone A
MFTALRLIAVSGIGCLLMTAAFAHVTLATKEAPVGAEYKAIFRVPHGCKGSGTIKLSVELPVGVIGVKPQPKPGWQIEIAKGVDDHPDHRSAVSEVVKAITWSGGNLPDDYYDEFVLSGRIDKALEPGTTLYFPVTQTCEQGIERWIEIPAAGKASRDYRSPAPSVKLLPAAAKSSD